MVLPIRPLPSIVIPAELLAADLQPAAGGFIEIPWGDAAVVNAALEAALQQALAAGAQFPAPQPQAAHLHLQPPPAAGPAVQIHHGALAENADAQAVALVANAPIAGPALVQANPVPAYPPLDLHPMELQIVAAAAAQSQSLG